MKQVNSYVFRRLSMVCILIVGCAGLSFGGGVMQGSGPQQGAKTTRSVRATEAVRAADAAKVAEVEDSNFVPGRNPMAEEAGSDVYATPALPLKPEMERLPPPVYAISGVKNQEIREDSFWEVVDIVVDLQHKQETFSKGLLEGADVSDWIINLPAGLEGRAHNVKKGATSIRIYVAGTPTVTARGEIKVKIPGTYLTGGADLQFVSPTETESLSVWEESQTAQ
jgi:hypothetical protein